MFLAGLCPGPAPECGHQEQAGNRKEVLEGVLPYSGRRRGDVKSSKEEYLPNREDAKTFS
jgi:hypothetical protein